MESQDHIQALLKKYVYGQCSAAEKLQVFEYLKFPEGVAGLEEILNEAAKGAFDRHPEIDPVVSREILTKLRNSIQEPARGATISAHRTAPAIRRYRGWKIAAASVGIIMFSIAVYLLMNQHVPIKYTTGYAEQKVIVLPDGSTVTLNSQSLLSFPGNWKSRQSREVRLEGEAYFEVAEHASKPFVVTTTGMRISVLGTSFNVKSYEDDETIETTLVQGEVLIRNLDERSAGESFFLKPNQKATYSRNSANIVLNEVKPEIYTSWKNGMLVFEDEPFAEILKELERWYGVKFDVPDGTSTQCRFTMKIKNESLAEVLKLFSSTTSAAFNVSDGKVTVQGELCKKM